MWHLHSNRQIMLGTVKFILVSNLQWHQFWREYSVNSFYRGSVVTEVNECFYNVVFCFLGRHQLLQTALVLFNTRGQLFIVITPLSFQWSFRTKFVKMVTDCFSYLVFSSFLSGFGFVRFSFLLCVPFTATVFRLKIN